MFVLLCSNILLHSVILFGIDDGRENDEHLSPADEADENVVEETLEVSRVFKVNVYLHYGSRKHMEQ